MARTELTRLQEEYLDWLLLDPDLRIPSTNGAWAEAHGISANTLTNWKKIPIFEQRWKDGIRGQAVNPERTQMLLDSLFKKGINGDVKSAQLYLQATGQMDRNTTINVKTEKASDLSDAELEALIGEYAQKERKQRQEDVKLDAKDVPKLREVIKEAENVKKS